MNLVGVGSICPSYPHVNMNLEMIMMMLVRSFLPCQISDELVQKLNGIL